MPKMTCRVLLSVMVLAGFGCQRGWMPNIADEDVPKLVAIFADVSGTSSAADWQIYRNAYEQIVLADEALLPGDRVVLSAISSTTLIDFQPVEDASLPDSGVSLNDMEEAELARLRLQVAFDELRSEAPSSRTHVVDAAVVAAQLFRNDPARPSRHLVLLSDMVEDSDVANFSKDAPDADTASAILESLASTGRIPDLQGVRVQVVGARADFPDAMIRIEGFWREFFSAAGAEMRSGDYSRAAAILRLNNGHR